MGSLRLQIGTSNEKIASIPSAARTAFSTSSTAMKKQRVCMAQKAGRSNWEVRL